jgi:hypothetical protein
VLGEPLTPTIVAAFVLILAGSVLATRSGQPRLQAAPGKPARDVLTERAGLDSSG